MISKNLSARLLSVCKFVSGLVESVDLLPCQLPVFFLMRSAACAPLTWQIKILKFPDLRIFVLLLASGIWFVISKNEDKNSEVMAVLQILSISDP